MAEDMYRGIDGIELCKERTEVAEIAKKYCAYGGRCQSEAVASRLNLGR
jgi:hypothetical protein